MTDVLALTSLPTDSVIQVKIRAQNSIGYGAYSQVNVVGALSQTKPSIMAAPTFDLAQSSNTQVYVKWTALTGANKGGSSLTLSSYDLYFYDTVSSQYVVKYSGTNLFYLDTTSISGGNTYQYKIKATNIYGSGPDSTVASIFTAQAPA